MSANRQLWELDRRPESILMATGAEPHNPAAIQIVPQVNYVASLWDVAAMAAVPVELFQVVTPQVLARRSVIEILAAMGEYRLRVVSLPAPLRFYFAQTSQIQANLVTFAGGSFLYRRPSAVIQSGDRAGIVNAGDALITSPTALVFEFIVQPGWLLGFYADADNTVINPSFLLREFDGQLDSVSGG